jgi:protein phosphatase
MKSDCFRAALDAYLTAASGDLSLYASGEKSLTLPLLSPDFLTSLFRHCQSVLACEPTLLDISSRCFVIGDIHGQVLDLIRILHTVGLPHAHSLLFLGDLVDRGEFSIETLVIVFLLKALYPERVFLIRGNHEFSVLCSQGNNGFKHQMMNVYNNEALYQQAVQVFHFIPLAARIDGKILCVHGGIGPSLSDVSAIAAILRPIEDIGDPLVDALTWSDPDEHVDTYEPSTTRGVGYLFGEAALRAFLAASKLAMLVRAHECVLDGYEWMFKGICVTVFSASNYCGVVKNQAAVLEVRNPQEWEIHPFPALSWLTRGRCSFRDLTFGGLGVKIRTGPITCRKLPELTVSKTKFTRRLAASASFSMLPSLAPRKVLPAVSNGTVPLLLSPLAAQRD